VYICKKAGPDNPQPLHGWRASVAARSLAPAEPWAARENRVPEKQRRMSLAIPAADCRTMEDVRAQIDRLDRAAVGLFAERQTYIERAAELKTARDAVHDDARIEDVVAKVIAEARRQGLSPKIAEPVWRELIARSIALEFEAFDQRAQSREV